MKKQRSNNKFLKIAAVSLVLLCKKIEKTLILK